MDPNAVHVANERLWAAHPELNRRQLTTDPADAALRAEWMKYYNDATSATAPPPAAVPAPATPPPPAPVVTPCPAPSPVTTSDCHDIKNHVKEGDIVLRGESGDDESDFIAKVSKCNYSHAGIVARNDKGELVVVDAYPGRGPGNKNAVASNSVDSFFLRSWCHAGACDPAQGRQGRQEGRPVGIRSIQGSRLYIRSVRPLEQRPQAALLRRFRVSVVPERRNRSGPR